MKKIILAFLGISSAICLSAGVTAANNTFYAKAEETQTTPIVSLSETKYKVSTDDTKLLMVTAIKDFSNVYEIGYEFNGYTVSEGDVAATNTYYDSLTTGGVTETAENIFGATWTDAKLLVWEVSNTANVTFTAYAKEGVMEGDKLIKPTTEIKATNSGRNNGKFTVTFLDDDGVTKLGTKQVYNGTPASALSDVTAPSKPGYTFVKWQMMSGDEYIDIPGNASLTEDITVKACYKDLLSVNFEDEVQYEITGNTGSVFQNTVGSGAYVPSNESSACAITWYIGHPVNGTKSLRLGINQGNITLKLKVSETAAEVLNKGGSLTLYAKAFLATNNGGVMKVADTTIPASYGSWTSDWVEVTIYDITADGDGYVSIPISASHMAMYVCIDDITVIPAQE